MPTVTSVLASGGVPSGGNNVTASWTPDGTSQYLLTVSAYVSAGSLPPAVSGVTGNGLTWTQITNVSGDATGTDRTIQYLYAVPAGGSAGAITISWSTVPTRASWVLDQVAGADSGLGSGTLPQAAVTNISSGANPTATLGSALQPGSVSYASACFESSAGTLGAGSGYTALGQVTSQSLAWSISEWNSTGSTSATATNTTVSNRHSIILIEIAAASTGVSGSAAVVQDSNTASASGQLGYAGTVAVTQANQTSAATGVLGYAGAVAVTQAANTAAASGVLGYTGTVARTQANNTASASGTVTTSGFTGTVAAIQASQTSTASGVLGYSGTVNVSQAANVAAATGKLGYSGTLARVQDSQTATASGLVAVPITGTVSVTQANQIATASGVTQPLVSFGSSSAGAGIVPSSQPGSGSVPYGASAAAVTPSASAGSGGVPTSTGA